MIDIRDKLIISWITSECLLFVLYPIIITFIEMYIGETYGNIFMMSCIISTIIMGIFVFMRPDLLIKWMGIEEEI